MTKFTINQLANMTAEQRSSVSRDEAKAAVLSVTDEQFARLSNEDKELVIVVRAMLSAA